MSVERSPARRTVLSANERDAWRYHVLRNGVRVEGAVHADIRTGAVRVVRRMEHRNLLSGEIRVGQAWVPLDRPDHERFDDLPLVENGVPVKVEIRRMVPPVGQAPWDAPEAADSAERFRREAVRLLESREQPVASLVAGGPGPEPEEPAELVLSGGPAAPGAAAPTPGFAGTGSLF